MKKQITFEVKELIICLSMALIYVFGILFLTGTIFSGYHLADDHEIIRRVYLYQNSELSLFDKILAGFPWVGIRFRPLYSFLRQVRCVLFGDNFVLWSICVGTEIAFAIFFSYLVARLFKCNKYMSFLFGLIIVTGEQSAIWWRLGPQEPTGIVLLMLSLFLLQKYELSQQKEWLISGSISSVITSFAKESFTFVLPFIPFLMIAYDIYMNDDEETVIVKFKNSIKKNLFLLFFCIIIFGANIIIILTQVGTDLAGYAGVDNSLGVLGYLRRMGGMVLFRFSIYFWVLVVIAVGCFLYSWIKKIDIRKDVFKSGCLFLVAIGIILAQLVLHVKSGMHERYFVPSTVAIALIAIVIVKEVVNRNGKVLLLYEIVWSLLILFLLCNTVIPQARIFAKGGQELAACFEVIQTNANRDGAVVVDIDAECNYAIETYLEYKMGYRNVLSYESDEFIDKVSLDSNTTIIDSLNEAEYILSYDSDNYENFILIGDYDAIKLWKNAEL